MDEKRASILKVAHVACHRGQIVGVLTGVAHEALCVDRICIESSSINPPAHAAPQTLPTIVAKRGDGRDDCRAAKSVQIVARDRVRRHKTAI